MLLLFTNDMLTINYRKIVVELLNPLIDRLFSKKKYVSHLR